MIAALLGGDLCNQTRYSLACTFVEYQYLHLPRESLSESERLLRTRALKWYRARYPEGARVTEVAKATLTLSQTCTRSPTYPEIIRITLKIKVKVLSVIQSFCEYPNNGDPTHKCAPI